jgi:hypothetical protein
VEDTNDVTSGPANTRTEHLRPTVEVPAWPADDLAVPVVDGLAVVDPDDLTAEMLRSAIVQHGHLLVRRLLGGSRVHRLIEAIDCGFQAFDAAESDEVEGQGSTWFDRFELPPKHADRADELERQRIRARGAGSLWIADSPRLFEELVETLDETGLDEVITSYLGERPVLSVTKCNARKVPLDTLYADWHQDGAFLGEGIRTINVWISLTRCGRTAPGLDIVPARVPLAPTGTEGAIFSWAVSPDMVAEVAGDVPIVRPEFDAGDVLLFDELFLHRTACDETMTEERYAVESWFFAPSSYPDTSVPLPY